MMCLAAVVVGLGSATSAVDIDTVTVGDAGNVDDTHGDGYGGVGHVYNIGKYEVTAGQYTEFLNNVAGVDTYGLYSTSMWSQVYGCKIERYDGAGTVADPYRYQVARNLANRPVNYVSWGDAARFANWLHNGQGSSTTEDGSYYLNGATSGVALQAVIREPDATWAITSEDEWYKAAYYKGGGTNAGYWDYPTSSDNVPSNDLTSPDDGNNATFFDGDYTIGAAYWRTEVGAHEDSESPYGTFDQGGNLHEWNEEIIGSFRGIRGASFSTSASGLQASVRSYIAPSFEGYSTGFRVSEVPEPATMAILVLGGAGMLRRRKCVQR